MPCGGNSDLNRRALAGAKNRGPHTAEVCATLAAPLPEWGRNFGIDLPPAVLYDGTSDNLRGEKRVKFQIELDREEDGRWIAEITSLPGVLAYGKSRQEAVAKVKALALRVLADEIEKEKKDKPLDISIACCP
jgi:predicted RNase H-like HicB family nuclease